MNALPQVRSELRRDVDAPTTVHGRGDYLVAFSGHEPESVVETTVWVLLISLIALSIVAGYLLWAKLSFSWPFSH